jgi:hypothetical protein
MQRSIYKIGKFFMRAAPSYHDRNDRGPVMTVRRVIAEIGYAFDDLGNSLG